MYKCYICQRGTPENRMPPFGTPESEAVINYYCLIAIEDGFEENFTQEGEAVLCGQCVIEALKVEVAYILSRLPLYQY